MEGTPSVSLYTDNQGHPNCNLKLAVHRIELLGGKDENQQQPQAAPQQQPPQQKQEGEDEDLPF